MSTQIEEAKQEINILRRVLQPHLSRMADVREGYAVLCLVLTIFKRDFPKVDPQLNKYFRELVSTLQSAHEDIESVIESAYGSESKNSLPAYYIDPHIFGESLYFPAFSLFEIEKNTWSEIQHNLNKCFDKIESAFTTYAEDNKVDPTITPLLTEINDYVRELAPALVCGGLSLDTNAGTLQFGKKAAIPVTVESNEVRFLKLLLERRGSAIPYFEIAKFLDLASSLTEQPIKEAPDDIKHLKLSLTKLLLSVGMSQGEIDKMLVVQRKIGYALHCA